MMNGNVKENRQLNECCYSASQCITLAHSLYSSRVSLHQTLLFLPVFQCTLLNLIIGLVPASFTPLFSLFNIPTRLLQHFRRSCSLMLFFLLSSSLPSTHPHTDALLHPFCLSQTYAHAHTLSLPLCHILLFPEFIQMQNTDVQISQYGDAIWRNLDMKHLHV